MEERFAVVYYSSLGLKVQFPKSSVYPMSCSRSFSMKGALSILLNVITERFTYMS